MTTIHSGKLAHLRGDPFEQPGALEIIERGALLVDDAGAILAAGDRNDLLTRAPSAAARARTWRRRRRSRRAWQRPPRFTFYAVPL